MAKMFPEELPREVLNDPKRSAEVKVYNALRDQLDNKYHVFYSSPWLGTNPDGSEKDGEADFLVVHADKGMLSIEVKGGRIAIDQNNQWTSTDRHNFTNDIKNPVNQARTSKHNLLKKLKASPYWESRYICTRHGVILPSVVRATRDLRADTPLELIAFVEDMEHLDAWVESRFASAEETDNEIEPLGDDGVYAFQDMLARKICLRVHLGTEIAGDLKEIRLKTDDQIHTLEALEEQRRMAIAGAAGTGKTILAMEKAIMLADAGKKVLLLCFNRPLGGYIAEKLAGYDGITAAHFHKYCRDVAKAAGEDLSTLSQQELERNLVEHFTEAEFPEFDAVILDEGQDFKDDWLSSLEVVVKGGDEGVLYIFYDDNQNVMNTNAQYIRTLPLSPYRLTRNFRNTKHIFRAAEPYYAGASVRAIGPEGQEPRLVEVSDSKTLKAQLTETVGNLTQRDGVSPGDIAILFPDTESASILSDDRGYRVGRNRATDAESRDPDKVVVDTIRRFKGLESPVILMVVDSLGTDELFYVGMTRAQSDLEIFGPAHVINKLKESS